MKWITGRRKAFARALALELLQERKQVWDHLTRAEQNDLVRDADRVLATWIRNAVVIEYDAEFREKTAPDDGEARSDPTRR